MKKVDVELSEICISVVEGVEWVYKTLNELDMNTIYNVSAEITGDTYVRSMMDTEAYPIYYKATVRYFEKQ